MGRELRRVALDFDWPQGKVWEGFINPLYVATPCPHCDGGYSPEATRLKNRWYGYAPFRPEDRGSIPFKPSDPPVRAFAERNVAHSPNFYGTGETAIQREAERLCDLFNSQWNHHLNADDVAALVEAGRLMDLTHTWTREAGWAPKDPPQVPTPAEVNAWSIGGFGHDSINQWVVVKAECARLGVPDTCEHCDGSGEVWPSDEAKTAYDAWEPTPPPEGEGWQLWETVSEGSPVSPVLPDRAAFVDWMATEGGYTRAAAESFADAGWAPSFVGVPGVGLTDGVEALADASP